MRVVAFILVFLLGSGPAFAWQEYVYLDQGVAIQFPAKPEAMKSVYDLLWPRDFLRRSTRPKTIMFSTS